MGHVRSNKRLHEAMKEYRKKFGRDYPILIETLGDPDKDADEVYRRIRENDPSHARYDPNVLY